jgi:hypothetical protein
VLFSKIDDQTVAAELEELAARASSI